MHSQNGMTLTEVLVASTLAVIVVFGFITADVSRFRIGEDIRRRSGVMTPERGNAARAVLHISKHLEVADLMDLGAVAAGVYQFRAPVGCTQATLPACLDLAASYDWYQYRLTADRLEFNTSSGATGCGTWKTLSRQIASLAMVYQDESPPPAGGIEPPNQDNNMVEFTFRWVDPAPGSPLAQDFTGQVAIRAGAYTNTNSGLAPSGVATPPLAACP